MGFKLNHLRTFMVVAHANNISAAARELGMTQPQVSRQMRILEKEVNLILFVRHSRGLTLTKQGEEFLKLCQDIFGRLTRGTDTIREKDSDSEGRFNFLSGNGLLETVMERSDLFSERLPKLSFNFSTIINVYHLIKSIDQLQIGKVDATVMVETVSDSDFIQRPLYKVPMRVYASPDYLQSHLVPKTLSDLQFHKVITYRGEKQAIELNKQIMNEDTTNFLQPFMEVGTAPSMRTALLNGAGIGCYGYNRNIIKRGLLADVFPDTPDQIIPYYYTYHKRLEGSPKIEAFYDFLKDITKVWERP